MDNERIYELLKIERECVLRNSRKECDRNCSYCDLVQTDEDLLEMYDAVIKSYLRRVEEDCREQEIVFNRLNGCS